MDVFEGVLGRRFRLILERVPLTRFLRLARQKRAMRNWLRNPGGSPPHVEKERAVMSYGYVYGLRHLVETGTYLGDMLAAVRDRFVSIVSIELDAQLCVHCQRRFRKARHVKVLQGDSGAVLPAVLRDVTEPSLFWLDAHHSSGVTARGQTVTPVLGELESILSHPVRGHVILIDDARFFTGDGGYPSLTAVRDLVRTLRPDRAVSVADDIIRITPGWCQEELGR